MGNSFGILEKINFINDKLNKCPQVKITKTDKIEFESLTNALKKLNLRIQMLPEK